MDERRCGGSRGVDQPCVPAAVPLVCVLPLTGVAAGVVAGTGVDAAGVMGAALCVAAGTGVDAAGVMAGVIASVTVGLGVTAVVGAGVGVDVGVAGALGVGAVGDAADAVVLVWLASARGRGVDEPGTRSTEVAVEDALLAVLEVPAVARLILRTVTAPVEVGASACSMDVCEPAPRRSSRSSSFRLEL